MTPKDPSEKIADAVLSDPVVVSAIEHVAEEPTPSRVASRKADQVAEQAETTLRTEGQRATSWLFESTQKNLALLAVGGFMLSHMSVVLSLGFVLITKWELLSDNPAAFAVLVAVLTSSLGALAALATGVGSTYFQRTNSHKVGGVSKDYEGR